MSIADELGYEERNEGMGYGVTGSYAPGTEIEYDGINDGDSVVLKYDSIRVHVRDVSYHDEEDVYWGEISGFSPDGGIQYGDLSLREEISFNEYHVFSCQRS